MNPPINRHNVQATRIANSVIGVGDYIEIEIEGNKTICEVKVFEVIFNHPITRPIDFVIWTRLKFNGEHTIECTTNQFKYLRHADKEEFLNAINEF